MGLIHLLYLYAVPLTFPNQTNGEQDKSMDVPLEVQEGPTAFLVYISVYLEPQTTCSGGLLSDIWTITAAKCLEGENHKNPNSTWLVAGFSGLQSVVGQVRRAVEITSHPEYDPKSFMHNIAIIKSQPFIYNQHLNSIAVSNYHEEKECRLVGWLGKGIDQPVILDESRSAERLFGLSYDICLQIGSFKNSTIYFRGLLGAPILCSNNLAGIISHTMGKCILAPVLYLDAQWMQQTVPDLKMISAARNNKIRPVLIFVVIFICKIYVN